MNQIIWPIFYIYAFLFVTFDLLLQINNLSKRPFNSNSSKLPNIVSNTPRLSYLDAMKYCPNGLCKSFLTFQTGLRRSSPSSWTFETLFRILFVDAGRISYRPGPHDCQGMRFRGLRTGTRISEIHDGEDDDLLRSPDFNINF